MDSFSYKDGVRAALASCFSCFTSAGSSNTISQPNDPNSRSNTSSANDLERLLRDTDSDALSLHSNFGASPSRRTRQRRRPKFSLTIFGYTLFGRPPIYLSDDEDDGPDGQNRAFITASSSTLDSDAAPLDPSTIERLSSPDHRAAAQRELEMRRREEEEQARRKAERRARRAERKARARASALMSLTGGGHGVDDEFEGFQGSGTILPQPVPEVGGVEIYPADTGSNSGDEDDADLGAESYVKRKKGHSATRSGSGSDSRSRTSASVSTGNASHAQGSGLHNPQQIPYSPNEMQFPALPKKKSHRSRRVSVLSSSTTSQSTSNAPYTPPAPDEGVVTFTSPPVAAFPIPIERELASYSQNREGAIQEFPSAGLSGGRKPKARDIGTFLSGINGI
ncbi:hypothetical protein ID866_7203 [Astraeus odoratus]|nr:hypothetical protein ID866_7203 [Astraeus odoratus]